MLGETWLQRGTDRVKAEEKPKFCAQLFAHTFFEIL